MNQHAKGANRFWGEKPHPKSKAEFFDAVTVPTPSGEGTVATIRMYGPIDSWGGYWGISTKDVGQVLDALPETVTQIILRINSPGGEVFEGVSILNMLRAHKATVTAVVDGLAASAASVIAAGCDETVMSPGTQMMIHSPWTFTLGNATELRKDADRLEGIEASLIEIYEAKAGSADWPALLAEETWYTATETVDAGLADRVAVIPDAGEAATVGEEDPIYVVVPLEGDEDSAHITRIAAFGRTPKLPSSSEPGDPNRKETVVAYDDLKAGFAKRLGVTEAEVTDEMLFAALDETLEEQAEPTTATPAAALPEGVVTIDASQLEQLRNDAAAGRAARDEQQHQARATLVKDAVKAGKIAPSRSEHWMTALEADPAAAATLNGLQPGLIPLEPKGVTGGVDEATDDDPVYSKVYPTSATEKEA